MARKVEILTLDETLALMRSYELPMSYEKLCAWIDAGAVPWALSGEFKGKTLRTVFKKPLVEWLEGLAVAV